MEKFAKSIEAAVKLKEIIAGGTVEKIDEAIYNCDNLCARVEFCETITRRTSNVTEVMVALNDRGEGLEVFTSFVECLKDLREKILKAEKDTVHATALITTTLYEDKEPSTEEGSVGGILVTVEYPQREDIPSESFAMHLY